MEPIQREILNYINTAGDNLFADWLDDLKDIKGRAILRKRLDRVEEGNFGDHRSVGGGVSELRIDYGPGYRIYFGEDGPVIILLLCGGDKRTQKKDIQKAQQYWEDYRREK